MNALIKRLYTVGTKGKAKDIVFEAKRNASEKFVLNAKKSSDTEKTEDQMDNKVYVDTLEQALELLKQGQHVMKLSSKDGQRALIEFAKIKIEYF